MFYIAFALPVFFMLVWMTQWIYRWKNPPCNGKLPPGSMGFPLIGETLYFFQKHDILDVHPFIKERVKRYGPFFRTNLLGHPVAVVTDHELCHFIFQQEGTSVQFWYLDTFTTLVGNQKLAMSTGNVHKYLRTMVLDRYAPEKQKEKTLSELEALTLEHLAIWASQESVEITESASRMSFSVSSKKLFSYNPGKHKDGLREKFCSFVKGLISFPLNVPGTGYHRCLKDQKMAISILRDIVKERLESPVDELHGDVLDAVVVELRKEEPIFDVDGAARYLFAVLFASFETVTLAISLLLTFLADHPSVLEELTEEHEAILQRRENPNSPVTWTEYKEMTFTSQVIRETLRRGNVVTFILRKVLKEINVNGYTIPEGWAIMLSPPCVQLSPEKYEDPLAFNPWRWKDQASNVASKNYIPFGGGARLCVGAEFARLQLAIFIHFLVTKYSWKVMKGADIKFTPGLIISDLHIKVWEKEAPCEPPVPSEKACNGNDNGKNNEIQEF